MASYRTIARPYARAVFQQALKSGELNAWSQCLAILEVIQQHPGVRYFLDSPAVKTEQRVDLFMDSVKHVMSLNDALLARIENFIRLLTDNKRQYVLPDIADLYHQLLSAHEGVVQVSVESAYPLSDAKRQSIQSAIEKRFKASVSIDYHENPSLMGGALIRAGNWVMDGSIQGKLNRLSETLKTG